MRTSSHAPFYDLFKLIVAIILLIIFLLLIWMRPAGSSQEASSILTSTPPPSTPTVAPPTETSIPPTATPVPSETLLPKETLVPTVTSTLPPTEQPADEPLPTPIVEIPADLEDCQVIAQSQLQVGGKATIQRKLNFRSSPGIFNNLILTNIPGTEVDVIGGPACTRYKNGGAYLWWEIQLPNGLTGWSAEASAFGSFYFMEPAK
jgi:hypothetical protein